MLLEAGLTNANWRSTTSGVKSVPLVSMYKNPYLAAASIICRPTSGLGSEILMIGRVKISWPDGLPFVVAIVSRSE